MEQQFKLAQLNREIDQMTLEQAREMLKEAMRNIMVREALTKEIMKEWLLKDMQKMG